MNALVYIVKDEYVCGVIFTGDKITRCAPIVRRELQGRSYADFLRWAMQYRARWQWLPVPDPDNWVL